MTSIKDRIQLFSNFMGISVRAFLTKAGISPSYLSNLKGSIGSDKMVGIIKAYPLLNIEWLITGEGEMTKGDDNQKTKIEEEATEVILNLSKTISMQQKEINRLQEEIAKRNDILKSLGHISAI
jgi:transcriptional regulator with XRE-family HTH domain